MRIADILPLTPFQRGLLFDAGVAEEATNDVYAVQLDIALRGDLDPRRLCAAVQTVVKRHPHLAARFSDQFDEPVQIVPADPVVPWQYVELDACELDERLDQIRDAERTAVCRLDQQPAFRAMLIRLADNKYRFVLTNHHIVVDRWSMRTLLREIFAAYHGQRLPAPTPYRRFTSWLGERDIDAARAAWRGVLADFDAPVLVGLHDRMEQGRRAIDPFRISADLTRATHELARTHRTTVSTVLQAAWALVLSSLTGQLDVAFGVVVAGRPAELAGADSMVGLMINTVPVRARMTARTSAADLLDQLQRDHNVTLDHDHLALNEIHHVCGHDRLFDTLFVYENYPIDGNASIQVGGLTVTDVISHDFNLYPLALVCGGPGREIQLRLEYDSEVFDAVEIAVLSTRLQWVLTMMTIDPPARLPSVDLHPMPRAG